jgi:hypothetical protein
VCEFEGEELTKGDVTPPVAEEENEREDGEEVGEDKVGGEVEGGTVVDFAGGREEVGGGRGREGGEGG